MNVNVSDFCIRRPVATLLMSMALIVGGLFAFGLLPVADVGERSWTALQ